MIVVGSHRRCLLGSQRLSLARGVTRSVRPSRNGRIATKELVDPVRARWQGRNASWRAERRFQRGNSPVGHPVQKTRRCASASSSRLSRRATRRPRRSCRLLHDELAELSHDLLSESSRTALSRQRTTAASALTAPSQRYTRLARLCPRTARIPRDARTWSWHQAAAPSRAFRIA